MRIPRTAAVFVVFLLFISPLTASAASELRITSKGELIASGLTVMQKAGTTMYVRASWDASFIRIVVTSDASTAITKNYGEKATVADIEVGHAIEVEGRLSTGGENITINATKIRDTALVKESKSFSGTIKSISTASQSFVLSDKSLGDITVLALPTATIMQGKRQIDFSALKKGDRVVSVAGTYDYTSKLLSPTSIEIYQAKDVFKARNFQGTLRSISGTSLPTQLVVSVDGTEYTVHLPANASVLSKSKAATSLRRFAEGDTVRFYGGIRETNLSEVDAEVVRDLNF